MARAKLARPSQVLCTRAPAELADRVRALASSSGQRVSAILREALLQRSGITPKVQAAVVEALLAGAEERLDLAEVAGVLLAEATSHQEERFIAKVATELQEAIDETTKAPKAPKLPKMLTGTGFTKFEHEVLVEFADSKSINEIQEKKTLLLHSAISATDESFVRKAARAAIAANQAAVKAQKKALPKPPKAKHVKEPRPRKLPQAKTAKKPPARPLAGEAPKLQKVLIFYPIAGKAGQPSKTVAIEIQAPVGARLSRMMGIAREKTGINFERRQSKAPTEVQTDEGIFYRGGRPLYTSDGFEAHDIEFKTWEALEKEEFTEAQKRFKKSPIQPLPAVPKKEPLGMVAKVEARAAKEKGKAAKLKAMRDEHAEACQGRRDTIEERKAISSPLAFRVGVTARPKEAALLSYAQMIAEARARGESRGDIRDEEKAAELALEAIYEREGQGGTMKEYKKKATQHHKQAAEYYNQPRSVHNIQEAYLNQAYGWAYAKLGSKRASPKGPTVKDLEAQVKKYAEIKRGEISTGEERKALPSVWEDQAEHWNNKIDSQPTREDLDILEGAILRATPPTKDLSRMMGRIAQRRAEMHAQEEHLSKLRADAAKPKTETAGQRYERERKKKAPGRKASLSVAIWPSILTYAGGPTNKRQDSVQ